MMGSTPSAPAPVPAPTPVPAASERMALVEALAVVRERWWLIAVSFVVCIGVAFALSARSVKQYTATASLLIRPSNLPALIAPTQAQSGDSATLARIQSDDVSLATSSPVATGVKRQLHTDESVGDLQNQITATADTTNDLIDIAAVDTSPSRAAALANAFAGQLVSYLTTQAQAQLISGQAKLQSELAKLPANDPGRPALQQGLKQIVALEAVTNGGAQVVQSAAVPSSPSSPSLKRDLALGAIVGLLIGLALAFLLARLDRRLKSPETIERLYGLTALASVPTQRRSAVTERETRGELEPFRILRDGLAYVSLREHSRVILVTSAISGEGKTRVATGLARAMAGAGNRVVVIEGDVHRPAVGSHLDMRSNGRGLMNALVEGGNASDLVLPTQQSSNMFVLASGPFTPCSAELLRLPALERVLNNLAGKFDFVIIDGPPLLPVADGQVMLGNSMIDVVLVVARPNLTTREDVRGALAVLRRHPERGLGLVLNGVRERKSEYYPYRASARDEDVPLPDGIVRSESDPPAPASSSSPISSPARPEPSSFAPASPIAQPVRSVASEIPPSYGSTTDR